MPNYSILPPNIFVLNAVQNRDYHVVPMMELLAMIIKPPFIEVVIASTANQSFLVGHYWIASCQF
jgi:hypothetical protein